MGVYRYEALDSAGNKQKGVVDADTEAHAVTKLRGQGLFPTSIQTGPPPAPLKGLTIGRSLEGRITPFTRQMATLLGAGFQVLDALTLIINGTQNLQFKQVLTSIREKVKEGHKYCDALAEHPGLFDSLYVNLVLAGEESAKLGDTLEGLADYLEEKKRLARKLASMIAYPVVVSLASIGIVVFLLVYTVPTLTEIFSQSGKDLPLSTTILITVSDGILHYWWVLLAIIALTIGSLRAYLRTKPGRAIADRLRIDLPVAGAFFKEVSVARFARTLSVLLGSGVEILRALEIVTRVVENVHIQASIETAREDISQGARIAELLGKSGIFPQMVLDMIEAGQSAGKGKLPDMLSRIADEYENSVETSLSLFVSLLEPIMILVMGAVVLFIVLAVLVPIFELNRGVF